MFANLPIEIQALVTDYLLANNFPAAKAIHDAWFDANTHQSDNEQAVPQHISHDAQTQKQSCENAYTQQPTTNLHENEQSINTTTNNNLIES